MPDISLIASTVVFALKQMFPCLPTCSLYHLFVQIEWISANNGPHWAHTICAQTTFLSGETRLPWSPRCCCQWLHQKGNISKLNNLKHFTHMVCVQAGYNRRTAEALLQKEAPKYGRFPLVKKMPQGPPKSLSAGNSPLDGGCKPLGACLTPTKVPPPLPATPPVAAVVTSGPSPPIYTSPLYRPDIDLSLPPPDLTGGRGNQSSSQVQVFCDQPRSSTSVNVILQPNTDSGSYVTYSSASTDHHRGLHSQLKITISPQGIHR